MKIVIAIDSLKGSLSSVEAGCAAADGIKNVYPNAETIICPLADGGEGTVEALTYAMGGYLEDLSVTGPLGEAVNCRYGIIDGGKSAVIEVAGAAGIVLVAEEKRNPMITTTYGAGEVIRAAIEKGCRRFLIGLGGSATNDGGVGMLQALGYVFSDKDGKPLPYGAGALKDLAEIDDSQVIPELAECSFTVACDVTNPLCGINGASAVFGPQKGADPETVRLMDKGLQHFAEKVKKKYPEADQNHPGAGAAGGLGFAFLTFTNAVLKSGVDLVLKETHLEEQIAGADLVITGEGRLDAQTAMGKGPAGVARLAKKYKKMVIALAGCVTDDAAVCNGEGMDAFFSIQRGITTLQEAMEKECARKNMVETTEQIFRLIRAVKKD